MDLNSKCEQEQEYMGMNKDTKVSIFFDMFKIDFTEYEVKIRKH